MEAQQSPTTGYGPANGARWYVALRVVFARVEVYGGSDVRFRLGTACAKYQSIPEVLKV